MSKGHTLHPMPDGQFIYLPDCDDGFPPDGPMTFVDKLIGFGLLAMVIVALGGVAGAIIWLLV